MTRRAATPERTVLARILLDLGGRPGLRLFRNNCGVALHADGSRVVYGLHPGSSDLIGITTLTITPDMVGRRVGVFTAIEAKTDVGRLKPEQRTFIDFVRAAGGIAGVARSPEDAAALVSAGPHHPKE